MYGIARARTNQTEHGIASTGKGRSFTSTIVLIGRPITWTHYRWGVRSDRIMAYTDSDWAANREDRRSVSGGMLVHNGGLLRFWSRRQKAVSLSSWESELYAAVSTGVEALGLQSGLKDFGNNTRVTIACDSQGVVDHTARQGLGLAKHVHTRHLWLQAARGCRPAGCGEDSNRAKSG